MKTNTIDWKKRMFGEETEEQKQHRLNVMEEHNATAFEGRLQADRARAASHVIRKRASTAAKTANAERVIAEKISKKAGSRYHHDVETYNRNV